MPKRILIASSKGGVGKTILAMHLADYYQTKNLSVVLVDADVNSSSVNWAKRSNRLDFPVILSDNYATGNEDIVIVDMGGEWNNQHTELAKKADLTIVPTFPDALSVTATIYLARFLTKELINFKVLVSASPPAPSKAGQETMEYLKSLKIPVFKTMIPRLAAFGRATLEGGTVRTLAESIKPVSLRKPLLKAWASVVAVGDEINV